MRFTKDLGVFLLGLLGMAGSALPTAGSARPAGAAPPRKVQSETYTGPITISQYERFQWIRDTLSKDGVNIPIPTGN